MMRRVPRRVVDAGGSSSSFPPSSGTVFDLIHTQNYILCFRTQYVPAYIWVRVFFLFLTFIKLDGTVGVKDLIMSQFHVSLLQVVRSSVLTAVKPDTTNLAAMLKSLVALTLRAKITNVNHESSDFNCLSFVRQKQIYKIMAFKDVSFKEAASIFDSGDGAGLVGDTPLARGLLSPRDCL